MQCRTDQDRFVVTYRSHREIQSTVAHREPSWPASPLPWSHRLLQYCGAKEVSHGPESSRDASTSIIPWDAAARPRAPDCGHTLADTGAYSEQSLYAGYDGVYGLGRSWPLGHVAYAARSRSSR